MKKSIDGIKTRFEQTDRLNPRSSRTYPSYVPLDTNSSRTFKTIDGIIRTQAQRPQVKRTIDVTKERWRARPPLPLDKFIVEKPILGDRKAKILKIIALLQYPAIIVVALVAAFSTFIGQWLVLAYAIYAVIRRTDSRPSFLVALLLLISIPLFQILQQSGVSENIAIYTYEMLVVGTIQSIIGLRKSKHMHSNSV